MSIKLGCFDGSRAVVSVGLTTYSLLDHITFLFRDSASRHAHHLPRSGRRCFCFSSSNPSPLSRSHSVYEWSFLLLLLFHFHVENMDEFSRQRGEEEVSAPPSDTMHTTRSPHHHHTTGTTSSSIDPSIAPQLSRRELRRLRRQNKNSNGCSASPTTRPATPTPPVCSPSERVAQIPVCGTSGLLTPSLQEAVRSAWEEGQAVRQRRGGSAAAPTRPITVPPPFKVGTLEMYRRFPEAYESFMRHHDCSLVEKYLHRVLDGIAAASGNYLDESIDDDEGEEPVDVATGRKRQRKQLATISPAAAVQYGASSSAALRVMDVGCGTGRIEEMLARHPAVSDVIAYDKEANMLPRCLLNTVRAAGAAPLREEEEDRQLEETNLLHSSGPDTAVPCSSPAWYRTEVQILPSAGSEDVAGVLRAVVPQDPPALALPLRICLRPVSYEDIHDGFLDLSNAPACDLMVCAWSLSYVQRQQWGGAKWHATTDTVLQNMVDHLKSNREKKRNAGQGRSGDTERQLAHPRRVAEASGAHESTSTPWTDVAVPPKGRSAILVIETLGHGVETPSRQSTLPKRLEEHWGFERVWVRTDYKFRTCDEAVAFTRFFFGREVAQQMESTRATVLPECTGIWIKWVE
eukprot:gene7440-5238_t